MSPDRVLEWTLAGYLAILALTACLLIVYILIQLFKRP